MNLWPKKLSVLGLAGGVYLVGQYFRGVWFERIPELCLYKESPTGEYCNWPYFDAGLALIAAGETLTIAGVILLFANAAGLRRWFWMSLVYIPLAAGATVYLSRELLLPLGGTPAPDMLVKNFGYLYLLITLIIVLHARYSAHTQARKPS